jgi:Skp family chaperone for outer membrane proteins
VKRTIITLAGVAALGVAAYVGSTLWAQTTPAQPRPAAPQTKVALLNLNYVIKNYNKWTSFQNDFKAVYTQFETQAKQKKSAMEAIAKEIQEGKLDPASKEAKEKQARQLQREMEDLNNDAKQALAKKSDDQMVIIYKEVREAGQRHAIAHGFDLVLHYNDAASQADFDAPANIARKMQVGGLVPMYWNPALDISQDVVNTLNASFKNAGGVPPATPGGVTPASATTPGGTPPRQ